MTASAFDLEAVRAHGRLGFGTCLTVLTLVGIAVFPAMALVSSMWSKAEYSHAWLILPLAALTYVDRFATARVGGPRWLGCVITAVAVLFLLAGWATRNTTLSIYGGILGLYGMTWAALGGRPMRTMTAPIVFLVFMIPLPLAVYISLSQSMQLVSSQAGVVLLRAVGVTVLRDGNIIDLPGGRLEVAEACSGLHYLFPLLSTSFLLAVLMDATWWRKLLVFASAFPIAIAMNAVRVALVGWLVDRYGMSMAEGLQHEVEGFAVFGLCVGLLVVEAQMLSGRGRPLPIDRLIPDRHKLQALTRWPTPTAFWLASLLLGGGAIVVACLPARVEAVPDRRALSLFPMTLDTWEGTPSPLDPAVLRALQLSDYVMANYVDTADTGTAPINFYIAYYATQRLGVQVHSPRLCIPGGGWDITDQGLIDVPTRTGATFTANRVIIAKNGTRQLVYYWFEERGRRSTGEAENKLFALLDAVMLNRSDGALIRLVAPITGAGPEIADRSLQALIRAASSRIPAFVPG